jgi:hypothetical protein
MYIPTYFLPFVTLQISSSLDSALPAAVRKSDWIEAFAACGCKSLYPPKKEEPSQVAVLL